MFWGMLSAVLLHTLICIHPLSRTVFLYHTLKIKPIVVHQVLDDCLIEVRTMGQLALARQKGGSDCLINSGGRSIEV